MVAEVTIRPVLAPDLEGVTPLAGSPERAVARLRAAEIGDDTMLVAVSAGELVGAVSVRWFGGCDPPHPWLYGLHVSEKSRRAGAGRRLVRAVEEIAAERGAETMTLDVDVDEHGAIAFYQTLGYAVARRHRHRWRAVDPDGAVLDEGVVPTLIMRRPLGA